MKQSVLNTATNRSHLPARGAPSQKETKVVFQSSIFRCELLVSGMVITSLKFLFDCCHLVDFFLGTSDR